jgi:hypothetical protein
LLAKSNGGRVILLNLEEEERTVPTSQILIVVSSEPEQRYLESDDHETSEMPCKEYAYKLGLNWEKKIHKTQTNFVFVFQCLFESSIQGVPDLYSFVGSCPHD